MSDYDPKDIPILDDVIEHVDDEGGSKKKTTDFNLSTIDTEPYTTEFSVNADVIKDNPHLFSTEPIDFSDQAPDTDVNVLVGTELINDDTITPAVEPQIGALDDIDNGDRDEATFYSVEAVTNGKEEEESIESALIDYKAVDETALSAIDISITDDPVVAMLNDLTEGQHTEAEQPTTTTLSLQSITDNIVKQLMPELEQQLRLLLKPALAKELAEKLPETIQLSDTVSPTDTNSH